MKAFSYAIVLAGLAVAGCATQNPPSESGDAGTACRPGAADVGITGSSREEHAEHRAAVNAASSGRNMQDSASPEVNLQELRRAYPHMDCDEQSSE